MKKAFVVVLLCSVSVTFAFGQAHGKLQIHHIGVGPPDESPAQCLKEGRQERTQMRKTMYWTKETEITFKPTLTQRKRFCMDQFTRVFQ